MIGRVAAATSEAIAEASRLLREGGLVAFPTETVYGLGADATNDSAIARVFGAKGRPRFNPLIVHVADVAQAERLVSFDARAQALAERWWPGPLTLVLPRLSDSGLSLLVSAGLDTVAVRAPDHAVAQALLAACGRPVAAPSANASGRISPTTAAHVMAEIGDRLALVLDGGACRVGLESSVVDLSSDQPVLLRPGGVGREALEEILGPLAAPGDGRPRSPGMFARHYAPHRGLRLNALAPQPGEVSLGFGAHDATFTLNLSPSGDLVEAAANLFAMLRTLDAGDDDGVIAVAPIPEEGLGVAINDRLRRAATPADPVKDGWDDHRGPAAACRLPEEGEPG